MEDFDKTLLKGYLLIVGTALILFAITMLLSYAEAVEWHNSHPHAVKTTIWQEIKRDITGEPYHFEYDSSIHGMTIINSTGGESNGRTN